MLSESKGDTVHHSQITAACEYRHPDVPVASDLIVAANKISYSMRQRDSKQVQPLAHSRTKRGTRVFSISQAKLLMTSYLQTAADRGENTQKKGDERWRCELSMKISILLTEQPQTSTSSAELSYHCLCN